MSRLNTKIRFGVLPWQTPGLLERVGLIEQQCIEVAWYVDADGRKHGGAAAVNAALDALGGVYAVAASFYHVPGLKQLEDLIYQWVSDNRYRLPGASDACKIPAKDETSGR